MKDNLYGKMLFVSFLILAIAIVIIKQKLPGCQEFYLEEKNRVYIGKVIKKYVDKEMHNSKTVVLEKNEKITKQSLDWDESGLYQYLQVGDSIVKKAGSYRVDLYRNRHLDRQFIIDYNCK